MALPNVGSSISLNQVNVELGLSGTTTISLNQSSVRTLFGVATGAISMYSGYGKSNAVVASVSSYTSTPSYRCFNQGFDRDISWYINAGTGNITITLQVAINNSCSWTTYQYNLGTITAGNWISVVAYNYIPAGSNCSYRLKMVNSAGTSYSPTIGVVFNWCDQYDYCSTSDNCADNGTWGCNECSEVCNCSPCTYDCNCDCVTGYGTGGCDCGSNCDWCNWYADYQCTGCCTGCCDENNENCTCDCSCNCGLVYNSNYPCPCGQQTCSNDCYCPCGETCGNGDRRTCQVHTTSNYVWSPSYPACY